MRRRKVGYGVKLVAPCPWAAFCASGNVLRCLKIEKSKAGLAWPVQCLKEIRGVKGVCVCEREREREKQAASLSGHGMH